MQFQKLNKVNRINKKKIKVRLIQNKINKFKNKI